MRAEIFLLSLSALAFELAITRVAAFLLQYHFAFLAVACGIGGLGLGAALASRRARAASVSAERLSAERAVSAVVGALLGVAALAFPGVASGRSHAVGAALLAGISLALFFALGHARGLAFEAARRVVRAAYICDVLGAALGAVLAVVALEVNGPGTAFAGAGVAALGAAAVASRRLRRRAAVLGAIAVTAFGLVAASIAAVPGAAGAPPESPLGHRFARGGVLVETRWNSYARTDLVSVPALGIHEIYSDGTAPALVVNDVRNPSVMAAHRGELPFVPFEIRHPEQVLSVGGGAGFDAWLALMAGARSVDVVEISGAILDLSASLVGTSADALGASGVRVVRGEGRRFLHESNKRYDLIVMALFQGEADARASIALLEASAYTREAVVAMIARLAPGGRIAVLFHDELLLERLWRTVEVAVGEKAAAAVGLSQRESAPYRYLLYFGLDQFSEAERGALARVIAEGRAVPVERASPKDARLTPTRDDQPFFFHTERSAPLALWLIAGAGLIASVGVAFRRGRQTATATPFSLHVVAFLTGVGFAGIEVLLVQRFLPPLGTALVALAAVSVAMLVGATCGALLGRRMPRSAVTAAALILACLGGVIAIGDEIAGGLLGLPLPLAIAIAVCVSTTAGIVAGIPFPAALELVAGEPGAVARMKALSSLGALSAASLFFAVALHAGYAVAALIPIVAYLGVALAWAIRKRRGSPTLALEPPTRP